MPIATGPVSDARLALPDRGAAVSSAVTVPSRSGSAPAVLQVSVSIRHPYRGDLSVVLVGPDGSTYQLASPSFLDHAADLRRTYAVQVPAARVGGVWTLSVTDVYLGDTGELEGWGIA